MTLTDYRFPPDIKEIPSFACGGVFNSPQEPPQCDGVARLLVLHTAGVFPYCIPCFLRDGAVANISFAIVSLTNYTDTDAGKLLANGFDGDCLMRIDDFLSSVWAWQKYQSALAISNVAAIPQPETQQTASIQPKKESS